MKISRVEVREEINRKLSAALGATDAAVVEANLDMAASLFVEIAGTSPG